MLVYDGNWQGNIAAQRTFSEKSDRKDACRDGSGFRVGGYAVCRHSDKVSIARGHVCRHSDKISFARWLDAEFSDVEDMSSSKFPVL